MLRFRIGYQYEDYNGEIAESGFSVVNVSNVQALDTFVIAQESVMQALSDARIVSALAYAKMPPYVDKPLTGPASIFTRLLCLFTNGPGFGSIVIPAPRPLDYDLVGPYAGIRVRKDVNDTSFYLNTLQVLLSQTLLPDGRVFPTGEWQAALMNYGR